MSDLLRALEIDGGIVCAVGAGGKKTTLYRIADAWPGPYALTATVFTAAPPRRLWDERILETDEALRDAVTAASHHRRLAYARSSDKPGRVAGVAPTLIETLHREAHRTLTLVKADGARMRGVKAPREGEPIVPPGADRVLHLSSAAVLGRPLDERVAHRPELAAEVMGLSLGETIEPAHLAALLVSPRGALQGSGNAPVVPIINQVDDPDRHSGAREAAEIAVARGSFDRVVLASMRAGAPVVEVVRRDALGAD